MHYSKCIPLSNVEFCDDFTCHTINASNVEKTYKICQIPGSDIQYKQQRILFPIPSGFRFVVTATFRQFGIRGSQERLEWIYHFSPEKLCRKEQLITDNGYSSKVIQQPTYSQDYTFPEPGEVGTQVT